MSEPAMSEPELFDVLTSAVPVSRTAAPSRTEQP